MLASIRGTVIEKSDFTAVVECNGLGVEVLLTRRAAELCSVNEPVFLYTFLQISDAGLALFGFADDVERRAFKLMTLTKGVGGKAAISILQYLSPAEIVTAVQQNETSLLTTVPGIGKKTAERICFELADRIQKTGFEQLVASSPETNEPAGEAVKAATGIIEALVSLGFDRAAALRAYKTVAEQNAQTTQTPLEENDAIMRSLRLLQPRK